MRKRQLLVFSFGSCSDVLLSRLSYSTKSVIFVWPLHNQSRWPTRLYAPMEFSQTHSETKGKAQWNTYGDPPNSDLLRRYGYIDVIDEGDGIMGNPADVVEVRADSISRICLQKKIDESLSEEGLKERVDWWLEEGGDE